MCEEKSENTYLATHAATNTAKREKLCESIVFAVAVRAVSFDSSSRIIEGLDAHIARGARSCVACIVFAF